MYLKKIKKNIVILFLGPLAQLVEHFPFKEGVIGSNPIRLTKTLRVVAAAAAALGVELLL